MREIKFRGYDNYYKCWRYGSLMSYYHFGTTVYEIITCPPPDFDSHRVASESVGQFTGLVDGSGQDIYEGDILRDYEGETFRVVWSDICGCYCFYASDGREEELSTDTSVIIGNIHDNPELLHKRDGSAV